MKKWEKAIYDKAKEGGFPICKRVFAGTANLETSEHTVIRHVNGQDDYKDREFIYSYWSSTPEKFKITTRVEKNTKTGETRP